VLERAKAQVKDQTAAKEGAELASNRRLEEKNQTQKDIADTQGEVERLKQDLDSRLEQLDRLRKEFVRLRTENQQLVQRVSR
jgi:hypothetical protein